MTLQHTTLQDVNIGIGRKRCFALTLVDRSYALDEQLDYIVSESCLVKRSVNELL